MTPGGRGRRHRVAGWASGIVVAAAATVAVAGWLRSGPGPGASVRAGPGPTSVTSARPTLPTVVTPRARVVVLGDSTAAGAGLPPLPGASATAAACGRSTLSYARDLAAWGWRVVNLACDGASISHGILGPQVAGALTVPAQLTEARKLRPASVVIVSVGADDLDWGAMVFGCAVTRGCGGPAAATAFQPSLAAFGVAYGRLLTRLAALPGHPRVIINQYYDPFGRQPRCLSPAGLTPAKLRILSARLASLNAVLARGAARSGFLSVRPSFAGHQICSAHPDVQGLLSPAPLHPTARGEVAIARADRSALRQTRAARG